jgi:hypothetical protein
MGFYNAALSKISSPEDLAVGGQYVQLVRTRAFDAFRTAADPSIRGSFNREVFERMASILTDRQPQQISVAGFNKYWNSDETDCDVIYQLRYPHWWTVVEVAFRWQRGTPNLTGFHLQRLQQSLQESNAFNAAGKDMRRYLALFAAAAVWAFSAVTLLVCAVTPGLKRKWLWLIAIAAGVGEYSVNWTSGVHAISPLSVAIPIAGVTSAGPYSPWMLFMGFPLGAVVFWVRRLQAAAPQLEALQT